MSSAENFTQNAKHLVLNCFICKLYLQLSPQPETSTGQNNATKSQTMDDVLEILIRTGGTLILVSFVSLELIFTNSNYSETSTNYN